MNIYKFNIYTYIKTEFEYIKVKFGQIYFLIPSH